MEKQELVHLWKRYISGQATEAEQRDLLAALRNDADAEVLEAIAQADELPAGDMRISDEDSEAVRSSLMKAIAERGNQTQAPVRSMPWFKWAAAAVILFAIATTYLLISKKETTVVVAYKGDVAAPKINKATLTLASGKQIVLDSVSKGSLAAEGAATANKTGDGALAYNGGSKLVEYHTLSNPKGSKPVELTLADGTKAWLNAASSITFPTAFTGITREVTMTGEAYFEVVHNAKQPFRVKARNQMIEDIGTSFNVNAYSDEPAVRTTLVEGSIKIDKTILQPGQQYENGLVAKANIEQALAWKNGFFSFDHADLATVMRQLARWYDVAVRFEGTPNNEPFQGEIGRGLTLAQVLKHLEQMRVHFRIEEDKTIVIMP